MKINTLMPYGLAILLIGSWLSCAKPKALFIVEVDSLTAPTQVQFTNKSEGARDYIWHFGDGNTTTGPNAKHKYVKSGRYQVSLEAIKGKYTDRFIKDIFIKAPSNCTVLFKTTLGDITIELFEDTPAHRDNFIKLVQEKYYDSLLFHRVINGFMIQGGDPQSKYAQKGEILGAGGPPYQIPAEFRPNRHHVRGALAAARTPDQVNPDKKSSGSQFYIVHGKLQSENQLRTYELQKNITYNPETYQIYLTQGGAPQLDQEYTVFGRVINGMEVIDAIASSSTDGRDRPIVDIRILQMLVII